MSYIYIIGPVEHIGKSLKVGVSKNPTRRLSNLSTGNSEKLKIHYLREVDDSIVYTIEKLIHKELARDKTLNEWFNVDLENLKLDIDFALIRYEDVDNLKQKHANRDGTLLI